MSKTIEEIRKKRIKLSNQIERLIKDFEEENDLLIDDCEVHIEREDSEWPSTHIVVSIKIEL